MPIGDDTRSALAVFGHVFDVDGATDLELELNTLTACAWRDDYKLSPAWAAIRTSVRRFVRAQLLTSTVTAVRVVAFRGGRELETITAIATHGPDLEAKRAEGAAGGPRRRR